MPKKMAPFFSVGKHFFKTNKQNPNETSFRRPARGLTVNPQKKIFMLKPRGYFQKIREP